LSEDQFEACILGRAGPAELAHINQCSECHAEFERFRKSLSLFRSAVSDLADDRAALQSSNLTAPALSTTGIPKWRWALVVATFVVAVAIPILVGETNRPKPTEQMSPEAVMERLNRHLARTVPAPMEPVMSLISSEPFASEPGGVQ
jgi:anti-sigma factor RsiW